MRLVLIGPPGAGKGTQADCLSAAFGVPKIATGDLIRLEIAKGTPRGQRCAVIFDGHLAPPADVRSLMLEALASATDGVILDGAVRTVQQAMDIDQLMTEAGTAVDAVVVFTVPVDELVRRAAARTVCATCQTPYAGVAPGTRCTRHEGTRTRCPGSLVRRPEDEPEAQRLRFQIYDETTRPALAYYAERGTPLIPVNGTGTVDEVTARILIGLGRTDLVPNGGAPQTFDPRTTAALSH
jgi:adenylate kinase